MIPRFRGRAFEVAGGWSFEVHVSLIGEETGDLFSCNKTYPTKESAIEGIQEFIKTSIKILSDEFPDLNINPNKYFDMKTDTKRTWDKTDEH